MVTLSSRAHPPKRFTRASADMMNERYGVMKPIVSARAIGNAEMKRGCAREEPIQCAIFKTKVTATETRSSNNPIPGPPGGKIENRRCTIVSLSALGSEANPNWSYTSITLLGAYAFTWVANL